LWIPGRTTLLLISILSALYLAVATSNIYTYRGSVYSTSPDNIYLTGTSDFYSMLARMGLRVSLGSPFDLVSLSSSHNRILYVVVGPEKPFSDEGIDAIAQIVRSGKAVLLVADEVGVSNNLLENIVGVRVSGKMLRSNITSSGYIVPILCLNNVILSTKVSWITGLSHNTSVFCWAEPRPGKRLPVGAITRAGNGYAIVISDSSIFSNFEMNGLEPFIPTKKIVAKLVREIINKYGIDYVIVDDEHYNKNAVLSLSAGARKALAAFASISNALSSFTKENIIAEIIALFLLPLILSIAFAGIPPRTRNEEKPVITLDELSRELSKALSRHKSRKQG
jgi:hypothetical protein